MKDRGNILPAWLQKSGYTTALIGKWLNGYGARDAHGEVPKGFDIWRGLLDVSAYDYFNFEMNRNGRLKTWGDADFARKLVEFAKVEATKQDNPSLATVLQKLTEVMGPRPYSYWGTSNPQDYSPDVTGKITEDLVAGQAKSRKPFFVWWAPAAPHREDVATTLMGRPGRDPRPAPRYDSRELAATRCRGRRASTSRTSPTSPPPCATPRSPLTQAQIDQLQLDYEGRAGSLLAVDDHVKKLVKILRKTDQLDNTLIVFVSDNGWLQGEHRIPGDKFLPYEESLRVPFILRGPGVPSRPDDPRPGLQHRLRADDAQLRAREGRPPDGRDFAGADRAPPLEAPEARARDRGAAAAVRGRTSPVSTPGTAPTRACAPTATRTSCGRRRASPSSTTAAATPTSSATSRAIRPTRGSGRGSRRSSSRSPTAGGGHVSSSRERRDGLGLMRRFLRGRSSRWSPSRRRWRPPRPRRRPTASQSGLHDARYCEIIALRGLPFPRDRHGLEHDR